MKRLNKGFIKVASVVTLGVVLVGAAYACESTYRYEAVSLAEAISEGKLYYDMTAYNLALCENAEISLMETVNGDLAVIISDKTIQGKTEIAGMDALYRCIKSFDSIPTMLDYFSYCNVDLSEPVLTFLTTNWNNESIAYITNE